MMKFLVDENVGLSIIKFLRDKGFDVKSVSELFPAREDAFIIETAYREGRIIITNDKDFGYLIFKTKLPPPAIILFRRQNESPAEKLTAFKSVLNIPEEKIHNHFIVVSDNKIRVRPLGNLRQ
jgi:predicted nuclease of predicted toxin-antitoxin system